MIHQLIFAHPRPGMAEKEFCDYWVHGHAVNFAAKIPQIRRYAVDTRVPLGPDADDPLWSGVGEIWLRDEKEQLESLQTPEFLEGARRDEPTWAAFWRTLVMDTDAHEWPGSEPLSSDRDWVKVFWLGKRTAGIPLEMARRYALEVHGPLLAGLPGMRRMVQGFTRDGAYAVGEATLDFAFQLWFDSADAFATALDSPEYAAVVADRQAFLETRYCHQLLTRENWVIGPEEGRA
jgi:uncharacterized protein (TIGR02118 family)